MDTFEANDGEIHLSVNAVRVLDASQIPVRDGDPYIAINARDPDGDNFHARFALSLPSAIAFRDRLAQEIADVSL